MKMSSVVVMVVLLGLVSVAEAAVILSRASPVYSYISTTGADANAVAGGTMWGVDWGSTGGYFPSATGVPGTLSYTFTTADEFGTLTLDYDAGYLNQAGSNTIVGTYSTGAGGSGTFYTGASPGGEFQLRPQVNVISDINSDSVTVTWTLFVPTNERSRAWLFPVGGPWPVAADGRFAATATFTPEPATVAMLGLGGLGLLTRRRRA